MRETQQRPIVFVGCYELTMCIIRCQPHTCIVCVLDRPRGLFHSCCFCSISSQLTNQSIGFRSFSMNGVKQCLILNSHDM